MVEVLATVFANAAAPQKSLLVVLIAAMLAAPLLAALAYSGLPILRRLLSELRLTAPLVGLLMAGMDSFHMARTILKLPIEVTARQLAPGLLEVSTFVVMGAAVGLIAQASLVALEVGERRIG
ncbi:hypothetical protein [Caulobacter sp. X]|uniref:hypothetical protein n=1 Tax=Caulobacter sp. X TaxID=2048901 RepID=UPI000C1558BF|nr:hypothetical protein [Caulobacter sp. X]PIB96781.1 hypothetical protein CSW60_20015 [Caulobacter sp. X]